MTTGHRGNLSLRSDHAPVVSLGFLGRLRAASSPALDAVGFGEFRGMRSTDDVGVRMAELKQWMRAETEASIDRDDDE